MDLEKLLADVDALPESTADRVAEIRRILTEQDGDIPYGELEQAATAQFEELYAGGEFDPNDTPKMGTLADIADALRAERHEAEQRSAELTQQVEQLAARISGANDPTDDPDESEDEQDSADADDDEDHAEGGGNPSDTAPTEAVDSQQQEGRQPVAASRRNRVSSRDLNAHRPKQPVGQSKPLRRVVLTAAADVPQVPSGSQLDMESLSHASIRRFQSMPLGAPNTHVKNGLAIIKTEADESVTVSGDRSDIAKIDAVADESRLPGGSLLSAHNQALTAAAQQGTFTYGGAWCAPSSTDYSLCPSLSTTSGIAEFPSITVTHGGLRYPVYRQYPDFDFEFQEFDENADYSETPKTCVSGVCPEWEEVRLRVWPLCVQGDILRERGYPELTQRFLDDVMVKHQHWMNARRLAWIDDASEALPAFDASTEMGSASYTIADRIGLLVEWMRERYRMAETSTLEGIAPMWLKGLLRSDIAKRNNRSSTSVADAEINQVFTDRGARIQWVYDWGGMSPDNGRPPAAFPDSASILLYPAGSWVSATQDIIDLSAVYDSTQLAQNVYTAVFSEQAYLMLNRCNPSYKLQLTGLCANGVVGGFRDICAPAGAGAGAPVEE